ncbi:hypothetical protein [Paenibacillus sp. UNC451MF]|uniref:hypothetical protein n=1 Tax=Paenibacillus sp. UNC451MF TaxID=1449063 RepID=UPI00048E1A1C|nr:hypothetical protein [Paenibacillus sp. UNC451MF]
MVKKYWESIVPYLTIATVLLVMLFVITVWLKALGFESTYIVAWIGFLGSILGGIIGGVVTYLGVKLTLEHQEKSRFLESFNKKITVVDEAVDNLKSIVSLSMLFVNYGDPVGIDKGKYIINQLIIFNEKLEVQLPKLRETIDFDVYYMIDLYSRKLLTLKPPEGISMDEHLLCYYYDSEKIDEYLDSAQRICGELFNYKDKLVKKYYGHSY